MIKMCAHTDDIFLHIIKKILSTFVNGEWENGAQCENFESRTAIKHTECCRVLLPNTKELLFYCSRGLLTQTPNERRLSGEEKFK